VSRKHNVAKQGRSNYKKRLRERGLSTSRMDELSSLRAKQPSITDLKQGNDRGYCGLEYQKGEVRTVRGDGSGGDAYKRRHR
jgi:hypothetical protein